MVYDVAIIGAGVIGSMIARELSRYTINVCLIDKEADVAMGTSKANSGIIHAGYGEDPGTLKAKLNVLGNVMMGQISNELGVHFKRIGSLVLAFSENDMIAVKALYARGLENGVPGMEILNGVQVKSMEPNVSDDVIGALFSPTTGIICPYELTIAAAENAVQNGVKVFLEHKVEGISRNEDIFIINTPQDKFEARFVVNAAGVYADTISAMVGEKDYIIKPRKGEYILLDKNLGNIVHNVIFQPPSNMGKGVLVSPTIDNNLLLGPTAKDIDDKEDTATTAQGLNEVINSARKSIPVLNLKEMITSFAGLRAVSSTNDFVIRPSEKVKGFIHAGGIQSPGLTACPQIAKYVVEILKEQGLALTENKDFNPIRKPVKRFNEMSIKERNEAINIDPKYGNIVCRCETVTEAEVINCIQGPLGARNLDAVKRRMRAGMGRCQGGFCAPRVMEILSRELGIPMDSITKKGGQSLMLVGKTK
jgi:glycerol-3-phosphate dehydrogenase